MGVLTNQRITTLVMSLIAVLIVALNFYLLWQTFIGG